MRQMRLVLDILRVHQYFAAWLTCNLKTISGDFDSIARHLPRSASGYFNRIWAGAHCKRKSQSRVWQEN